MPVNTRVEVLGAGDAIRSLRKIDPQLRKDLTKDVKRVAAPIIDDAIRNYPPQMLSGMARAWVQRGRQLFPYDQGRAVKGLSVKIDTRRRATSVIRIIQKDTAAAVAEVAGNKLGQQLSQRFARPGRFLWKAADRRMPEVQQQMETVIMGVIHKVNRELN